MQPTLKLKRDRKLAFKLDDQIKQKRQTDYRSTASHSCAKAESTLK
jgi:hypothetical protein